MPRFVLKPIRDTADAAAIISSLPGITVIDGVGSRLLFVEAQGNALESLPERGWKAYPEMTYPAPWAYLRPWGARAP
jgi:hypothetical protein